MGRYEHDVPFLTGQQGQEQLLLLPKSPYSMPRTYSILILQVHAMGVQGVNAVL
jgi:hypothetical protein